MFRFAAVAALLAVLSACGPTKGGACASSDPWVCFDETTMLWCEGGAWTAWRCPGGCRKVGPETSARYSCFADGAQPGDACPGVFAPSTAPFSTPTYSLGACSSATQVVACDGSAFRATACPGGCSVNAANYAITCKP